jgi:hypothetical protein
MSTRIIVVNNKISNFVSICFIAFIFFNLGSCLRMKPSISISKEVLLQMTPNDWVYCSEENKTCSFTGKKLVRYGNSGVFEYKEVENSVSCSNSVFGDPIKSVKKFCHIKNIPYTWVFCANESSKCTFSGVTVVKYGTETYFNYKYASTSIDCNNATFGDPINGKKKYCYYMAEDDYSDCASENQTCSFKGTNIVRFGSGASWAYKEIVDSTPCTTSIFGSVSTSTTSRICQTKNSPYFWVECAKENETCSFTGDSVVRFGQNGIYYYKYATNEISCNNATFGDPLYGVSKICEYIASTTSETPEALKTLSSTYQESEPDSESVAIEKSTCSYDSGFGFNGNCLSSKWSTILAKSPLPSDVSTALGFLTEIAYKITSNYDVCVGDYKGGDIEKNPTLTYTKCDSVPLMENFQYGLFGSYILSVPCGTTLQNLNSCAIFDKCGTVALSINAGIAQCLATYSTGIAAILSPLSGTLDYLSFGISPKRRFTLRIPIAYRNGDKIESKEISTYGHFFVGLGLKFPIDIHFGGMSFDKIFSFDVNSTYIIDFGDSASIVTSLIQTIYSATKSNAEAIVKSILNTGAEMTISIKGLLSLNLNDLTRGFLPNIDLDLGQASILVTSGAKSASGMKPGVYIHVSSDIAKNLFIIYKRNLDQFASVMNIFGIPQISFPEIKLSLGIFIQDDALGFEFFGLGFTFKCMFINSKTSGSCDFSHKFFTSIIESGKWVIKHAKKLFDDTGKQVISFATDAGKFAEYAAAETIKFFQNDARNFFERDSVSALKGAASEVKDFFEGDVTDAFDTAGKSVKKFFSKW